MKTLLVVFIILILSFPMEAQDIWFIHPSHGETLNNNFSETQVAVNISYNKELSMSYYYVKLITHSQTYNSRVSGIPQWLYLSAGSYTWKLELWEGNELSQEFKTAEETITFHVKFNLSAQNIFGSGSINIDGGTLSSGSSKLKFIGDNLAVGAIDQNYNNYHWIWNSSGTNNSIWRRKGKSEGSFFEIQGATSRNHNYSVQSTDNYATIQAAMRKECNISFSNQFSGISMGGEMYIDGGWVNAPTAETVVEQNPIVFMAENYYDENNIRYIFDKWNDNITSKSRTIYPSSHEQYTAIYKGYPIFEDPMRGLVISGVREGKTYYIKLDWNEHPNSYVTQYHIYRYTKYGSVTTDPVHVATRNRGTTTFTDYAFTYAPTTGEYQVYYDVKAYFSLDGTVSPNNFTMVRGNDNQIEKSGNEIEEELIKEYAINNYPNPFNPTTTIRYQLPKAGHVQVKVYDALGKEVATLVNEHLESGRYEARFGENNLPSGMYIYTIKVNDYYASKKMLLIK